MIHVREVPAGVTIAAVAGACAGADFERALACDLRLAAATATFSAEGAGEGAAIRLARLLGEARAKDIVLTGRRFDARAALRLGVVTRVVPAASLEAEAQAAADLIGARPPLAVRAIKTCVERARDLTPADALALEHEHFARLLATEDHRAAVEAFFARRPPVFTGR